MPDRPRFVPSFDVPADADVARARWITVRAGDVALVHPADLGITPVAQHLLGMDGDVPVYAADVPADADVDRGAFTGLMQLYGRVGDDDWHVAGRAVQLVEWGRTHRYCGRCGTANEPATGERALVCPSCGLKAYPRLAPAVIALVEHDDRILLARNVHFPLPMFSLLAGFVEPGETLEQAVHREIAEEVGIAVTDVRYAGSQPWPFPHSIMIGFTCRYAGGELSCDPTEIAEAAWFGRDDLPMVPPRMSIARVLIDRWMAAG